jgi:hypothetical protein
MKLNEFRNLIRTEIKSVLKESKRQPLQEILVDKMGSIGSEVLKSPYFFTTALYGKEAYRNDFDFAKTPEWKAFEKEWIAKTKSLYARIKDNADLDLTPAQARMLDKVASDYDGHIQDDSVEDAISTLPDIWNAQIKVLNKIL